MSKIGKIITFILLLVFTGNPGNAHGQGLAMHGTPKYATDFTHLQYVKPDAPKAGTLKQAVIGSFDTVNPFSLKGNPAQGLNLVHDRLMERVWDEPFTLYPLIAQEALVPEDRSSITFVLDARARFSDGSKITVDDVLFSFNTLKEKGRPNMRRVYQLVQNVETDRESRSITFHLSDRRDRETVMILAMMPVLSKAFWEGRDFEASLLEPGITSGPYKISHISPGRQLVLTRITDHWAKNLPVRVGHMNFDTLVYDYYRDDSVAFEGFKAGALNWRRENDIARWISGYEDRATRHKQIVLDSIPHGRPERYRAFMFNLRREPFTDIRVRKALYLAFDFEWINKNLYHGMEKRIESFFPNTDLGATNKCVEAVSSDIVCDIEKNLLTDLKTSELNIYPQDNPQNLDHRVRLKQADALLRESGWVINQKGLRAHKETGKPLAFEILLSAPEDEKIALSYKSSLARLGIEVTLRTMDQAAYRARMNQYDFDMTLSFWLTSLSPGAEQLLFWGCRAASEPARLNYTGVCHPALDTISAGLADTRTREALVAHTRALDRVLKSLYIAVPLGYRGQDLIAYDKSLCRPAAVPLYGTVLETWWAGACAN